MRNFSFDDLRPAHPDTSINTIMLAFRVPIHFCFIFLQVFIYCCYMVTFEFPIAKSYTYNTISITFTYSQPPFVLFFSPQNFRTNRFVGMSLYLIQFTFQTFGSEQRVWLHNAIWGGGNQRKRISLWNSYQWAAHSAATRPSNKQNSTRSQKWKRREQYAIW